MRSLTAVLSAWMLAALPVSSQAETWTIDTSHSGAHFSVRHMMVSNVRGEFTKLTGQVEFDPSDVSQAKLEATIDAATISTRNERRDEHLKSADFFDVANYPTITFKSTKVSKAADGSLKLSGDLTLHGVTKEVVFDVEPLSQVILDQGGSARVGTSATTKISRKDFGLTWNRALEAGGVTVGDEVTIMVDVELRKGESSEKKAKGKGGRKK